MSAPLAFILRAPGTNCDQETAFAFELAGARTQQVHILELRQNPEWLRRSQILAIPGGFSYGDDVGSGKILANQLRHFLPDALREFRDEEKLILGICNGFQILLKSGLLMPKDEDEGDLATLSHNTSGRYLDRWVHLQTGATSSPFLKDITTMELPIAHGEGQFVCRKEWILKGLSQANQVALRYTSAAGEADLAENPNGSQDNIAGLTDYTGRVFGLMPHPERHILATHHPRWTRQGLKKEGDGLAIFRNAVNYFA
jgi:phosphoribosylformylglycinamidine synthase subunit PurQ / glutaminase